jgi:hypothetical protein
MGQGQFLQRRDHPRARREPGSPGSRARGQKEARLVWPRRTQWRDQFAERVRSVLRSKPVYNACADICVAGRGLNHNSITGTLAAWTLRYCPFVFCGSQREAADFGIPVRHGRPRGRQGAQTRGLVCLGIRLRKYYSSNRARAGKGGDLSLLVFDPKV